MDSLIILAITFALLWVLLVLPRRRMQQAHQRMVASLEVGDEVITSAGIYGEVTSLESDVVHVRVADGVVLRVARLAIGRLVTPEDRPAAAGPDAVDREHDGAEPTAERATEPPPDGAGHG